MRTSIRNCKYDSNLLIVSNTHCWSLIKTLIPMEFHFLSTEMKGIVLRALRYHCYLYNNVNTLSNCQLTTLNWVSYTNDVVQLFISVENILTEGELLVICRNTFIWFKILNLHADIWIAFGWCRQTLSRYSSDRFVLSSRCT